MKRIGTLMACGALALAFSACDDGRGDPDGGPIVLSDTGTGDPDAGPTTTPDSGPEPTPDSGVEPACAMDLPEFPAALSPRCSDETRTCVNGCLSAPNPSMCVNTCLAADTTPDGMIGTQPVGCAECVGFVQQYCIQENGGESLIDALRCCATENGCTNEACIQSMCPAEVGALNSPSNPAASSCLILPTTGPYAVCYPAEPAP